MSINKGGGRLGEKLPHLTEAEAIVFKAEINAYLERTNTAPARLSIWARGYAAAIYIMMKNPIPTKKVAAHFRAAMAEYPNGQPRARDCAETKPGSASKLAEPRLKSDEIEARREAARKIRAEHFARCRNAHLARYGTLIGFGRPLRALGR